MDKKKLGLIWGVFMTLFYICMGLLFMLSDIFDIRKSFLIVIGILFILYGIFRGYQMWKQITAD